jgi:copper chaperone CopZ
MIKKVILQVDGMGCQGCVAAVTEKLKAVSGIREVLVTLTPPEAAVTFDDQLTTLARLINSTVGSGYPLRLKDEMEGK